MGAEAFFQKDLSKAGNTQAGSLSVLTKSRAFSSVNNPTFHL